MKRTKIVCTLGPASSTRETIEKLIENGMNAIRFNFSHTKGSDILNTVNLVKDIRKEKNIPIAIILDTKGPEVRIYGYKEKIELPKESNIKIISYEKEDISSIDSENKFTFYTNLPNIGKIVKIGTKILLKDGFVEGIVKNIIDDKSIEITIKNNGNINPKAHLSIPNIDYNLEFLSSKDKEDIFFAIENDFEYIALSFVSCIDDVIKVRELIKDYSKKFNKECKIKIISKIENKKAVENIDDIIKFSDGIMVARGDLGVELDIELVPIIQKRIIKLCYRAGKPVIVATQMLESMIDNPIPTRAEASDVANACYDLSSAVMLSGETAVGNDPVKVVKTMSKIITQVENSLDYNELISELTRIPKNVDVTTSIATRSVAIAYDIDAKLISVITGSGYSARMISKVRPKLPIVAYTFHQQIYHQLSLNWGVIPRLIEKNDDFEKMVNNIKEDIAKLNYAEKDSYFLLVSGFPIGTEGTTNSIRVIKIE